MAGQPGRLEPRLSDWDASWALNPSRGPAPTAGGIEPRLRGPDHRKPAHHATLLPLRHYPAWTPGIGRIVEMRDLRSMVVARVLA